MEVQFIKVNPLTRLALDEEVGKLPRDLPLNLVVGVAPGERGEVPPSLEALTTPIRRRDSLTTLSWTLAKDYPDLALTRALARALDVSLTLHAPYYVDFYGSEEARRRSVQQIQWAGVLADGLGAKLAVTHLGFYGPGERADTIQELTQIVQELESWLTKFSRGGVRIAIEPSGHPDVFGSRAEVLELARRVKGVVPVLNVPHLAAREHASFEDAESLAPVVDEFVKASHGDLYLNFSGVEFYGPGEFRLTPIKRGQVRFDPVAEILSERDYDVTVISSSPLLEHDAMYTKLLYERALTRRWTKRHAAAAAAAKPKPPVLPVRPAAPLVSPRPGTARAPIRPRPVADARRRAVVHGRR